MTPEGEVRTGWRARDTWKQRQLERGLKKGGYEGGWRLYLTEKAAQGLSSQRIAFQIVADAGMALDQTTIHGWLRQALTELKALAATREAMKKP